LHIFVPQDEDPKHPQDPKGFYVAVLILASISVLGMLISLGV